MEKNFEFYYKEANKELEDDNIKGAEENITKCIEMKGDFGPAFFTKGMINLENNKIKEAIKDFDKAIKNLDEKSQDMKHIIYYSRGMANDDLEKTMEAISDFSKCVEIKPDFADAYYQRGICYFEIEKIQEAMDDFNKAIEIDPEYANAYFTRGYVYQEVEEYKKAINDYTISIKLRPDNELNSSAYFARGFCFHEREEFEKALEDYTKAIEMGYEDNDIYELRAEIYNKLGQTKKAEEDMKKIK